MSPDYTLEQLTTGCNGRRWRAAAERGALGGESSMGSPTARGILCSVDLSAAVELSNEEGEGVRE
jgi:hypothetical protein